MILEMISINAFIPTSTQLSDYYNVVTGKVNTIQ